mgnify:CR=1 FL=1
MDNYLNDIPFLYSSKGRASRLCWLCSRYSVIAAPRFVKQDVRSPRPVFFTQASIQRAAASCKKWLPAVSFLGVQAGGGSVGYLVSFTVGNISSFHKFLTFSTEFSTDYKRQKSTAFQWKSRLKVLISRSFVLHNGLWRAVSPCFYGFAY